MSAATAPEADRSAEIGSVRSLPQALPRPSRTCAGHAFRGGLPLVIRYDRSPPDLSDTRFKPSFLRTVPAKNPRTECCCQPVIFMIVEIVAPPGLRSSASTADCLDRSE